MVFNHQSHHLFDPNLFPSWFIGARTRWTSNLICRCAFPSFWMVFCVKDPRGRFLNCPSVLKCLPAVFSVLLSSLGMAGTLFSHRPKLRGRTFMGEDGFSCFGAVLTGDDFGELAIPLFGASLISQYRISELAPLSVSEFMSLRWGAMSLSENKLEAVELAVSPLFASVRYRWNGNSSHALDGADTSWRLWWTVSLTSLVSARGCRCAAPGCSDTDADTDVVTDDSVALVLDDSCLLNLNWRLSWQRVRAGLYGWFCCKCLKWFSGSAVEWPQSSQTYTWKIRE